MTPVTMDSCDVNGKLVRRFPHSSFLVDYGPLLQHKTPFATPLLNRACVDSTHYTTCLSWATLIDGHTNEASLAGPHPPT